MGYRPTKMHGIMTGNEAVRVVCTQNRGSLRLLVLGFARNERTSPCFQGRNLFNKRSARIGRSFLQDTTLLGSRGVWRPRRRPRELVSIRVRGTNKGQPIRDELFGEGFICWRHWLEDRGPVKSVTVSESNSTVRGKQRTLCWFRGTSSSSLRHVLL